MIAPDGRIVLVGKEAGQRLYAVGAHRGAVARAGSKRWDWRVWYVLGPDTLGKGQARTLAEAERACLDRLAEVAGI